MTERVGWIVSSGCMLAVAPGGVFVVEGVVGEASVEDPDEPVGEGAYGPAVGGAAGAVLVAELARE